MQADNIYIENKTKNMNSFIDFIPPHNNIFDVVYTCIDQKEKTLHCMPSNYEWHLMYWNNDLDLNINDRLTPGIFNWELPDRHSLILNKFNAKLKRVEIRVQNKNNFEILSMGYFGEMNFTSGYLSRVLHHMSYDAYKERKKFGDKVLFPLRASGLSIDKTIIDKPVNIILEGDLLQTASSKNNRYNFDGVVLTHKEMQTIRLILMCNNQQEISLKMRCNLTSTKNRIMRIKEKFQCVGSNNSHLFRELAKYGVISSLDIYRG